MICENQNHTKAKLKYIEHHSQTCLNSFIKFPMLFSYVLRTELIQNYRHRKDVNSIYRMLFTISKRSC